MNPTSFELHCLELFRPLGPARTRRMFGGHGFYVDDLFIALAAGERLYLKVDEQTRARFEDAGCTPFVYDSAGKRVALGYWTAPGDAMESPVLMRPWARLAMEAALRARNTPKSRITRPSAGKAVASSTSATARKRQR